MSPALESKKVREQFINWAATDLLTALQAT